MSLALTGVVLAGILYVSVLMFYGEEIFDTDWAVDNPCGGFFDCLFDDIGQILDSIGDILQFLTITGIDSSQADPNFLLGIRFFLGAIWLVIIIGFVRGSSQS